MKSKIHALLILILLLVNISYAKEILKVGTPLKCTTYFDQNQQKSHVISQGGICRVKIEEVIPRLYLIQDYYSDSMKNATNAYLIHNINDIHNFTPKSIEGNLVLYNRDGNKIFEIPYMRGKKEGYVFSWYENGEKNTEVYYSNNNMNGLYRSWHENGQLKSIGFYKDNLSEGYWKYWNKDNQLEVQQQFVDGEADGVFLFWHENGSLKKRIPYSKGFENGLGEIWYQNGVKSLEILFDNGNIQECSYFDKKGNSIYKKEKDVFICQSVYKLL